MKKLIALLLVSGLLIFTLTGCSLLKTAKDIKDGLEDIGDIIGDPNDDGDDNGDDEEEGYKSVFSGTVHYPENPAELLRNLSEFGYEFSSQNEDGNTNFWSLHFVLEGNEEVDGVPADIFTVTKVENGETVVEQQWYDEEGNMVKAVRDGEELDEWYAMPLKMLLGIYTNKVLLTTSVVDEDGKVETFVYSLEDKRSQGSDVGNLEICEIRGKFLKIVHIYGLVEKAGEKHFALIRSEVPESEVFEQLLVTHMVFR